MEIYADAVLAIMELTNAVCSEFPSFGENKASKFSSIGIHISGIASWSSKGYSFLRVENGLITALILFANLCKLMSFSLLFLLAILSLLDAFFYA